MPRALVVRRRSIKKAFAPEKGCNRIVMQIHDHAPNAWGRSFLWGGILLGLLLVAVLLTHGFGLLGAGKPADTGPAMLLRQGNQIVIPESSPLRKRLTVTPAH